MANTYLLSRKANAGANDISYLKLIKYKSVYEKKRLEIKNDTQKKAAFCM